MSAYSAEKMKVFFNCELDGDVVDCIELKRSYFENRAIEQTTNAAAADLKMYIRVTPLNNRVEYRVTTQFQAGGSLTLDYQLNSALSPAELMEKLLIFLGEVTKPYIRMSDGSAAEESIEEEKPFYLNPNAGLTAQKQQASTYLNSFAQVDANYSTKQWRLIGSTYTQYIVSKVEKSDFNPGLSTKITTYGVDGGAVRSVSKNGHWDVALFIRNKNVTNDIQLGANNGNIPEDVLNNTSHKTAIRAGVEWILVPFLTETSKGNVAIRYSLSAENHKYVDPESYQYIRETFSRHLVEIFLNKHFEKLDVSLSAGAYTTSFRSAPLTGVNGTLSVKYQLNKRMTVGATGSVQYAKNRLLSTAENSNSFTGLSGGTKSAITYDGALTLSYTLGSIRIFNKEQRWKN